VTSATRIAWTEPSASGDRLLLVIDLRPLAGLAVAGVLILTPLLAAPLGRLSSPLAMLVVLPPLALSLEALGWRDQLAAQLTRIRSPLPRLVVTYAAWLVTSATLTLDVAAVAAEVRAGRPSRNRPTSRCAAIARRWSTSTTVDAPR
jgi:hypothetical protein